MPDIESEILAEEDGDTGPNSSDLQINSDKDDTTGMNIALDERAESEEEETESICSEEEVAEGIREDEITEGDLEGQNGDIEEQIAEGAEGDIAQITEKEENTEKITEEDNNTEEPETYKEREEEETTRPLWRIRLFIDTNNTTNRQQVTFFGYLNEVRSFKQYG
jgi:hypothetical protein